MRVWALVTMSVLVIALAPWIGSTSLSELSDFIFWQLRFPRVLSGILVGATLGITGAAFQALFGNALATPSTTGTTAGASLGALAALVLLPVSWTANGWTLVAMAFAGALAISIPVAAFARRARIDDVLLAGIAFTLAAGSVTTGLQFKADIAATYRAVQWSLGTLAQIGYQGTWVLLPFAVISVIGLLLQTRALESLVAGEEQAFSQGVDVAKVRMRVLLLGALGVAACVAWCGPIAFVGLVVPHLVRLGLGSVRRVLIPMSGVVGAAFLVLCDSVARVLLSGQELPVGVLTAAVGAPMLIWMIVRQRR